MSLESMPVRRGVRELISECGRTLPQRARRASFRARILHAREGQREERDGDGGDERAPVDETRFAAQLGDKIVIVERLYARVPVARPACGERDSSLLARLQ